MSTDKKARNDSLESVFAKLRAFDALEVGQVNVEPNRIVAPYTVVKGKERETTELSFRYGENVFTPGDTASENLAAMVTAQAALNYGLFCKKLVFHGPFDSADRRFLADMAQNTAREIFVMKFLEHNPFLQGSAVNLPAVKAASYLQAVLEFPDAAPSLPRTPAQTDRHAHAILSSGGKDSLLTFGLLTEIGREVHPIYINESGRHWYTAINAFRHHEATHALTARVWTDVDRIYTWMLRRMPFIRPDFHKLRFDEYPIRLWTVAVLIFGAMPIIRKRGIGRVVLGDEYDTSEIRKTEGITHYNGLYDQSRFFDNALTRYYRKKKWELTQISLLRPLSELLIEKILVERYPHLQKNQVSCHAAHADGERFKPCGKCEKCRRIIGMLMALDADPKNCGYTQKQIDEAGPALGRLGIAQEIGLIRFLGDKLSKKNYIPSDSPLAKEAKPSPEILQMRFHPDRSPADYMPVDLRKDLYPIYLAHATGAVEKHGRHWAETNPLSDAYLSTPYPFEGSVRPQTTEPVVERRKGQKREFILGELTWPEAKTRLGEIDIALLPVGAIEQHGPHLPLDTDAFDADYLAQAVAQRCSRPRPLVLPLLPYGVSFHHDDFPGTISVSPDVLAKMVYEIGIAIAKSGISKLIIINGHGGNNAALNFAAQNIHRDIQIFTCVESGETSDPDIAALATTQGDVHAGEIETSTSLALRPHLVDMEKAQTSVPRFSSRYLNFSSQRGVEWYARTSKLSKSGILGDAKKATEEKGRKMWEVMIDHLVRFVEDIKGMPLDEIFQRRL